LSFFFFPAFNEESRIANVIDEINATLTGISIVVINDASRDDTAYNAKKAGATVISHPYNMGYSAGLMTGLKYAKLMDFEHVVFFDGDGQHIASEVKELFRESIKTGSDIVIGSRFINKQDYNHGMFKTIGTKFFTGLIKLFSRKKITDPTSGFQLLNKKAIKEYSNRIDYLEYPDANLIIYMFRKGLKISETPVRMRERTDGVAMHSGIWKPVRYMFLVVYSFMLAALFSRAD
jgi:glycosyltransferase involved in cell wall biosynthesis